MCFKVVLIGIQRAMNFYTYHNENIYQVTSVPKPMHDNHRPVLIAQWAERKLEEPRQKKGKITTDDFARALSSTFDKDQHHGKHIHLGLVEKATILLDKVFIKTGKHAGSVTL